MSSDVQPIPSAPDFRFLFESLPGQVVVVLPDDPKFTVVAVTDTYLHTVRQTREYMLGRGLFEVFPEGPDPAHARTIQNVRESFRQILRSRQAADPLPFQQYDLPAANGNGSDLDEKHWALVSSPVLGSSGSVQYIVHRVEDVTERVLAEAGLRETEDHLRYTVELTPQVPWTADPQGGILDFSQKWLQLTGLSAAEAMGEGWMQVPHPDDRPRMVEAWMRALATGEPYDVEHRIRLADGSYRWMRSRAYPRRDADGRILRWYGTTEDIDEKTRAERRNAFLVQLDDAVRSLTSPAAIKQIAARMLGEHLGVNRCAYADLDEAGQWFHLTGDGYNLGVPPLTGSNALDDFGPVCAARMRAGEAYVIEDSETDSDTPAARQAWCLADVRAGIHVPLMKEGRMVAAMAAQQSTPRRWEPDEIELVRMVASRCWESIERARVTRQLQESREHLRAIYNGTHEHLGLISPDGVLLEANRASLAFGPYRAEDVIGRPFWDTPWFDHSPEAVAPVREAFQRAAAGETVHFEIALRRPSGEYRTFDVSMHPVRDEDGRIVFIVPDGRDITERKAAEEELRQQWHLFDAALSNSPDYVYIFDNEGRLAYANRALLSVWNTELGDAAGKRVPEISTAADRGERFQSQLEQVIATKQPLRDHVPFVLPNGESRHFDYNLIPILGEDGSVEAVAGSSRDVTERQQMQQALAESEKRLQQVFSQAPVAIAVLRGKEMLMELANPSYQALLHGRQVEGRRLADVIPELGEDVWAILRGVLETGEPFAAREYFIPFDADRDGVVEDHWFNLVYHPLREGDEVTGIVAVGNDVTTQVVARQELERVNRELEEFAYVASHDLQEPLRMINIYTQLLLRNHFSPHPEAQQCADMVRNGVRRMEALIHDLLIFSRTVHTDDTPAATADLTSVLADAVAVLRDRIQETGAVIDAPELPAVCGEPAQLALVFQNLLSNSLKYRKQDSAPKIRITATCQNNRCTVTVQDNGIGFDPKHAERIFGLFKRLHKEEYPGTGLGLAICRRILERFRGEIWAEGRPGEGATFCFSLPLAAAANSAASPTDS